MNQDAPTSDRKFFLFQANPKIWDLQEALRNQSLTEFNMSRLKGEVVPGSMVILWSSGERRGVYGLARVTSGVRHRTTNVEEFSNLDRDCVELEVVANWHDSPVLATEVEHFNWFPPVMQGSNFRSTAEAFFGLIEWRARRQEGVGHRIWKLAPGENSKYWPQFLSRSMASIGWDIGNLSNLESEEVMEELVKDRYPNDAEDRSATARTLFAINRRFLPGDYIVGKDGFAGYNGVGRVTSGYRYVNPVEGADCHQVGVDWFEKEYKAPCLRKHRPTLTELTGHTEELRHIESLYGFEFENHKTDGGRVAQPRDWFASSFLPEDVLESILSGLEHKKNVILQGPPGTGKTFVAKLLAYAMMKEEDDARIEMVQFHQSYSYEDFIQGFRPRKEQGFERRDGVFYRFCERAKRDLDRPYFFVIDEINRGNLSKIFGELMMLIEADKRGEKHRVQLTYSSGGEHFFIPANVHIIGTMNTADRSLAMVDYALRRRFAFFDVEPQFSESKFPKFLRQQGLKKSFSKDLCERMKALNKTIAEDPNLGKGFEIGHSYFCSGMEKGMDEKAWFNSIVEFEIGPQLREYWFDNLDEANTHIGKLTEGLKK